MHDVAGAAGVEGGDIPVSDDLLFTLGDGHCEIDDAAVTRRMSAPFGIDSTSR